ncbi:MAG: hypothetical protein GY702_12730 [Desulfobulbaceae bacterium]|nr:hypothetical protein [Desulfobulbaceae bacterium]
MMTTKPNAQNHYFILVVIFLFSLVESILPVPSQAMESVAEHRTIESPPGGVSEDTDVLAIRTIRNDQRNYIITPGTRVAIHSPEIRLTPGFHAKSGSQIVMGAPVVYLNFVVLEDDADFPDHDGITSTCGDVGGCCPDRAGSYHCIVEEDIHWLIDSINETFVSNEGKKIFDLRVGNVTLYNELTHNDKYTTDLYSELVLLPMIYEESEYSSAVIKEAYNSCSSQTLCNHDAINVYIYENRFHDEGNNGRGHYNSGEPIILVDFDRVKYDTVTGGIKFEARPFAHELGHAFRLAHTCEEGVTNATIDSNLMASHFFCGTLDDNAADENYCPTLADDRYGAREGGVAYTSLLNCPISSQENYQEYGQIEVMYWHSMIIQNNLRPSFPH